MDEVTRNGDAAAMREADDPLCEAGKVTWHVSEEGGGPDVGISIGLGNGRQLWIGELLDSESSGVGFALWTQAGKAAYAAMDEWNDVRDFFEDHIAPLFRALPTQEIETGGEDQVERIAQAIHESDPDVGVTWTDWVSYAEAHPDHLQAVDYVRRQARAVAALTQAACPIGAGEELPDDVVALVCAARQIMDRGYVSTSIAEERGDALALDKALEAFASRVCYDDEGGSLSDAHAVPCTCERTLQKNGAQE